MDDTVSLRIDALQQAGAMVDAINAGVMLLRQQAGVVAALPDSALRGVIWHAITTSVDFDLFDWLAEGWTTLADLRALKGAAGTAHLVLGKMPIRGELHPVVTVTVGGVPHDFPFTVALIAEFDAIVLTVVNGRLTEFVAGACDLLLATSYRQTAFGKPAKIKSFTSPFRHTLKAPGLAIG